MGPTLHCRHHTRPPGVTMTTIIDLVPPLQTAPPPEPPLWVNVSRGRRLALVVVGGELDVATVPILTGIVDRLTASGRFRRVVIDMSAVTFVDLHGLRTLERLADEVDGGAVVEIVPGEALLRLRRALSGFWSL